MKKILLVVALWSLPAFSAEILPGEHGDTSGAAAAKELADAQAAQQKAQEKLQEEQEDQRAAQARLQQAQQAAKADPDPVAQETVAADQQSLDTVQGQIEEQEAVVTADTQDVTSDQAAAIEATRGTETLPGSGPEVPMENQPVTIADILDELRANEATQARINTLLNESSDNKNLESDLATIQILATRLLNAHDFLTFLDEKSSAVQFTNGDIDALFLTGDFLPAMNLSPDASKLATMTQSDLMGRFKTLQDAVTSVDAITADGKVTVRNKTVQLFTGDDVAAKGDILKQFITDREQVLIDPLVIKTTTLSDLTGLMGLFPESGQAKVLAKAEKMITDAVAQFTDKTQQLDTLFAQYGSIALNKAAYDTTDAVTLANQLIALAGQFPDSAIEAAKIAFPHLEETLNTLKTSRNAVKKTYEKLIGIIFGQITATKAQLTTLLATSQYKQTTAIDLAKQLIKLAGQITPDQLNSVKSVFSEFDTIGGASNLEIVCSNILGDSNSGLGTFSALLQMQGKPLSGRNLVGNLSSSIVNPVEALFYTDFHAEEAVFSIPTRLEAFSILEAADKSEDKSGLDVRQQEFIKNVVAEYKTLLDLQSQVRANNTANVETGCRALYAQVLKTTAGKGTLSVEVNFQLDMKKAINKILTSISAQPL